MPSRPLQRLISRHLELGRLEEALVPLHIVTFDLLAGEEVVLSEGPAHDAVLAAVAIPGVLAPVPWRKRLLVDGGVVNNTPISHAVELGAERIYVLPTADPSARRMATAPRGALDAAAHALALTIDARLRADLVHYADRAELIVLPAISPTRVKPTDFDQPDRLITGALHASRMLLDEIPLPARAAA